MTSKDFSNSEFPTTGEGRVYHLGAKKGEIYNRIVTSGDVGRIKRIKTHLTEIHYEIESSRCFYIVSGVYKGFNVTLVASLMGYPNMDFAVRELRAIVDGPMVIIRLGTCGSPRADSRLGDIAIGRETRGIYRNPDAFRPGAPADMEKYHITLPAKGCDRLSDIVKAKLIEQELNVVEGTTFSGCTFYSAQGRVGVHFDDKNEHILDRIVNEVPDAVNIEMESFHLFDLAENAMPGYEMYVSAIAIIIAKRDSGAFITNEEKYKAELICGTACLDTIVEFEF
ncbi:hypothetical protein PCE1_003808 [Barthelona sp. PCE]